MTAPRTDDGPTGTTGWLPGLLPVLAGWIVARLCVLAGFALSGALVDRLDTPRGEFHRLQGLLTWDADHYRLIAEQWYVAPDAHRFFPLYPALGRALAPVFGGREDIALIVIANVAAFAGAWVLWKLVVEVFDSSPTADRAAWMVAVFPAAFVFVFAYTEGLALLLVAATLLALHRRAFAVAGLLGLVAALLRPVGGLVLVPILIELWRCRPRPRLGVSAVAVAGPIVGLLGAMTWIAAATDDFWGPVTIQQDIRGGFQDPVTRVIEPIGEVLAGNFRDVYNLGFMIALIALFVIAIRRRQPLSWLTYAGISLLILLSSQVTDSLGRYGMVVVPFVVALAQWAERRWQQALVGAASCSGLIWLTSEAWLGRMVP